MASAPSQETASATTLPAARNPLPGWAPLLVYPLFLGSGIAGLIYEVVWTRLLLNLFGAGVYAVCAVLTAFMAGLALGSWLLGRVSDRMQRPFRAYGIIEIIIGVCGVAAGWIFSHAGGLEAWAYASWGKTSGTSVPLVVWRFIFSGAVMLVPTTLMGATLPILTRFMVRNRAHLGAHVSALYSINTFGAVLGTFLAGFLLIATFGVQNTWLIAAGLNVLVGLSAIALSALIEKYGMPAAPASMPEKPLVTKAYVAKKIQIQAVMFSALISGALALASQVIWTRSLVFTFQYLKNTTYAFSAMLTVFLIGLAVGSGLIGLVIDRQRHPLRLYGLLLILLGMAVQFSILMVYGSPALVIADPLIMETTGLKWGLAVLNVMMQSAGVMLLPTLLMGMAFPVAARVIADAKHVGQDVGKLYAINTLGAIFGAGISVFLIIPSFGLVGGLILLGLLYAMLGLLVLLSDADARRLLVAGVVVTVLMTGAVYMRLPTDPTLGSKVLQRMDGGYFNKLVFYEEGPMATVSVVEHNTLDRTIYVDGVGVAGTDIILQTDQKSLAHVPMMLIEDPEFAATVGFGSGGCSYSLLQHSRLKKIHCIEICNTVVAAAPTLEAANHRFWDPKDPRYGIVYDDARSYLRYTDQKYDFISTDCTDLRYKSNANLYDSEYFEVCKERLTDDGMVIVWMPLAGLSEDIFKVSLRTFYDVFPNMGIFFMNNSPTHYILYVGWQDKIEIDFERIKERLEEDSVRRDLEEIYLGDPVKLVSCFITGGEKLGAWLAEGEQVLNTENHPVIEFESPKFGYDDKPLIDNLDHLMNIRVSPREYIKPGSMTAEELERLERYERALPHIIKGHAHYRKTELAQAAEEYMKAAAITPEDVSLTQYALRFPTLMRRIQIENRNPVLFKMLASVYRLQTDKLADAYSLLERSLPLFEQRINNPATSEENKEYYVRQLSEAREWMDQLALEMKSIGYEDLDQ